ncbi:stage II sporulation protein R [Natroniella sulfidigena]|uniref:stage II sporulation protein R n=1 Tax=Natroniella sulfidigena TaxID=723921 RepID=UPI00200A49C8|nr:stage II sporulation protein R [Natroniella sulfidigena]MCK8817386.1 stage II sporulation protein R [Natroniella sulfidigena]
MKRVKFIILIAILISFVFVTGYRNSFTIKEGNLKAYGSEDLLRLHVVANSNSLDDQRIKRAVKAEILKETTYLFKHLDNPLQAERVVKDNLSEIKQIVKDKLRANDQDYNVELELGKFDFPTRSYGGTTLEAGEYQALQVRIGESNGENWWCVLFPPLCFVDSIEELSEKELNKLAKKEDDIENELPVEFKFKLVEVIEENPQVVKSKLKLAQILESSFPGLNKLLFSGEQNTKDK